MNGVDLGETLNDGGTYRVRRARRRSDGRRVLLKEPASATPSAEDVARLVNSWELARDLRIPGLREVLDLWSEPGRSVLVLEDAGGRSLRDALTDGALPVASVLAIGAELALTLAHLHAQGILHGDVSPGNVIIEGKNNRSWLIDLGLAHRLSGESGSVVAVGGTLPYLAPEQTGRTSQGRDARSDLYSLGATLYHCLAGRPPFESQDLGALLHAHLAEQAVPVSQLSSAVPEGVSAIIMKLLAKRPAERYAGGFGLALDLREAAARLAADGDVPPFPLARRDPPARPALTHGLVARDGEQAALAERLEAVRVGPSAGVFVSGLSGTGKTALVESVLPRMNRAGARIGRSKATRLGATPFAGLGQCVRDLVDGLLAESDPELARWKDRLRQSLGSGAGLLTGLVPRLELVIGRLPDLSSEPQSIEASNQLKNALSAFMRCVASGARPVVLFLDDLQWADAQSIALMGHLLTDRSVEHVLVVGGFRHDEVGAEHALSQVLDTLKSGAGNHRDIPLRAIDLAGCSRVVGLMLGVSADVVAPLAQAVHEATGGNPLLVERLVLSLFNDRRLWFNVDLGRWSWDIGAGELGITEDMATLLAESIADLPERTRQTLAAAACLGSKVRLEVLASALGDQTSATAHDVELAADARVLALSPSPDASDETGDRSWGVLEFSHDTLQEAAYATIDGNSRPAFHLALGRRLARVDAAWLSDSHVFDIVTQMNLGREAIDDPSEEVELARLNLRAARRAMRGVAFDLAADLLTEARVCLGSRGWENQPTLTLQVHDLLARAAMLAGRHDLSSQVLDASVPHCADRRQRLALETTRIRLQGLTGDHSGAIETAIRALPDLGFTVPEDEAGWQAAAGAELARIDELMTDRPVADLALADAASDPEVALQLAVLNDMISVASTSPTLYPLLVGRMVRLSIEHGPSEHSPYGFCIFGLLQVLMGDTALGDAFGQMALALNQRQDRPDLAPPLNHVYGGLISHWHHPYREGYERTVRGHENAVEYGIFDAAGWAGMIAPFLGLAGGLGLQYLEDQSRAFLATCRDLLRYDDAIHTLAFALHQIAALRGDSEAVTSLEQRGLPADELESRLTHYPMVLTATGTAALQRAVILGHLDEARDRLVFLGDPATERLAGGVILTPEVVFYDSLVCVMEDPVGADAPARLRANAERLRQWGGDCPANHLYKQLLVEAELADLESRESDAIDLLERAADAADGGGILHGAALVMERTAAFHRRRGRGRIVRGYLAEARRYWARWGADARVHQLDALDPALRRMSHTSLGPDTTSVETARLDLESLNELSETVSTGVGRYEVLEHLISVALGSTGAERCAFLMPHPEGLRVAAEGAAGRASNVRPSLEPQGEWDDLAWEPILFAWRSQADVIIHDAPDHTVFGRDPWVRRSGLRSLLCLPVRQAGEPFGLIYLEHTAASGAFFPGRVSLARLAASSAATAIENADLLRKHRDITTELGAIVQERTKELESVYRDHLLILDSIADGVAWLDLEGNITFVNRAACRLTGYSSSELCATDGHTLLHPWGPDGRPVAKKDCPLCQRSGNKGPGAEPIDTTIRRRDGAALPIERSVHGIKDETGTPLGLVVVFRDRSERRRLEAQLRQAQKMEAVGLFAGGLAHDFNNLLTPILGNVDLVRAELAQDHPSQAGLESATTAVERAAELVQQMLAFGRRTELFLTAVDLRSVVNEAVHFLRHSIDRRILVEWHEPSYAPTVWADAGQLGQVLLNLLLNARDAVEAKQDFDGEEPRIEISLERAPPRAVSPTGAAAGRHEALITVRDNGIGIDKASAMRVFEPFFTTKELGKGSGLGLSVAHGIIEQHGGTVELDSTLGRGCTFKVHLPEHREPLAAASEPTVEAGPGMGRLLVVDDEPMVRRVAVQMLKKMGYETVEASNGAEAVEIHREQRDSLAGLVLDLSMPVMSGREALERIRAVDADIPILICTGYDLMADGEGGDRAGGEAVLRKPFSFKGLSRAIGSLLSG